MYITWYFDYFPKVFMVLSFVFNPMFIYLNLTDKKKTLGKYRHCLLCFSLFNTLYSLVEAICPCAAYGSDHVLLVYLSGGPFFDNLKVGQLAASIRCGFISLSYGILSIHFIYRYFALFNPSVNETMTSKRGVCGLFIFFISHGIIWATVCETNLYATEETRETAREEFQTLFNTNISEVPFLNVFFTSKDVRNLYRCWIGIVILAIISTSSISLYITLGYKIFNKLKDVKSISMNTRKLHRQLLRILVIQTAIPTIISFAPCMVEWFIPFFGVHIGNFGTIGMISLSAFPCLDAIAIIGLLPVYRTRFLVKHYAESSIAARSSQVQFSDTQDRRRISRSN